MTENEKLAMQLIKTARELLTTDKRADVFDKVYDKFNKKDYFGNKEVLKTHVDNWKHYVEKGDKEALKYKEEDILRIYGDHYKNLSRKNTYEGLKKAIKSKDKYELSAILVPSQKFVRALFEAITKKKVKAKNRKEVKQFVEEFIGEK